MVPGDGGQYSQRFTVHPMPSDGDRATAWRKWREQFTIYLKATRQAGDSTSDEVKTSLLLHALGSEGQEVYDSLHFTNEGDNEKYDIVLEKLEAYFIPKTNLTCERYRFFTRRKQVRRLTITLQPCESYQRLVSLATSGIPSSGTSSCWDWRMRGSRNAC